MTSDPAAGSDSGGMAGMGGDGESAATMPYIATPDGPQRHRVLGGFAVVNAMVLGAAALARRKGVLARQSTLNSRAGLPTRASRNTKTTDGDAA
jgi:hypothetical protein